MTRVASNLPPQLTPFIGREAEVRDLTDLLADPACRLLTLVGPGGVGKTRLALEVATRQQPDYADGTCFVALQHINTPECLSETIADAIQFPLSGTGEPQVQILSALRDKHLLLVLDNFEHLLVAVDLLTAILSAAPEVQVLVTSREVLNVQEEWLYPLAGMDVPARDDERDIASYSAVQLFVERARRVCRDFALSSQQVAVVHICQLVGGMPLALELAAGWTTTLPCDRIAVEIARNLDFLATRLRNIPERHRSMRAVFDQTWQLLTPQERNVFQRLSVFRGGFRQEAATVVAGATLATLAALVDKSLLRCTPDGRYQIHELLRQFASEQLSLLPNEVVRVHDAHCDYYADFLEAQWSEMAGFQMAAVAIAETELENIREAWQWAVANTRLECIYKTAFKLFNLCVAKIGTAKRLVRWTRHWRCCIPCRLAICKNKRWPSCWFSKAGSICGLAGLSKPKQPLSRV